MTLLDAIRLAFTNLGHAKLRTALTMLGVSIGIASLSGMVSLGVGLEDSLMSRFAQSGMFDSITVTASPIGGPIANFGARGRRGRGAANGRGAAPNRAEAIPNDDTKPETKRPQLDDEAVTKIAALADVKTVYPNIRLPLQVAYKDYSELIFAAGVPMSAAGQGPFESITHGTFFKNEDETACMITLDLAKRLTDQDPKTLVGQPVSISYAASGANAAGTRTAAAPDSASGTAAMNPMAAIAAGMQVQRHDEPCPIVGIIERESAPGVGPSVAPLMIPLAKARAIDAVQITNAESLLRGSSGAARTYTALTVKVSSAKRTQDVEDRIKDLGYSAISLNDAMRGAKRAFLVLDILLSLIGSIALTVSSLGIVNTMVMSILERTREIGIMKAIGGGDGDIRRIFLIEASVIGLFGGIAGVLIGWLVGRAVNFGANIYIQNQGGTPGDLFSMPFWLIASAVGFSVLVSLIAGSYPARRAARLDPIQALRHD